MSVYLPRKEANRVNTFKQVILLISTDCNLDCLYCYARDLGDSSSIYASKEVIDRAIEYLDTPGSVLQISGGEPLLFPASVYYAVKKTRQRRPKSQIKLKTNGTFIDPAIAMFIRENGVDIGVSLDGPPEINDSIRGRTQDTLKGILRLKENDVDISLTAVITNRNAACLDRLAALALLMGNVRSLSFDLLRKPASGMGVYESLMPEVSDLKKGFSRAYDILYKRGSGSNTVLSDIALAESRDHNISGGNTHYCWSAMGESITITPHGEVYSCPSLIYDDNAYLGHILEKNDLEKKSSRSCLEIKTCNFCEAAHICRGGCPSRAYLMGGDRLAVNSLECEYRKYIYGKYIAPARKQPAGLANR